MQLRCLWKRRQRPCTGSTLHQQALRRNPAPDMSVSQPPGPVKQRNEHWRIPHSVIGDLDCQYLLCVHICHHVELDKPSLDLPLVSDPLPPVVLLQTCGVDCKADRCRSAACDGKHTVVSFDIQCLKPFVYGCVTGRIPVRRASQSAFPAGACTASPSSILPPSGLQTAIRRTGTVHPPCSCLHQSPLCIFAVCPR